MTAISDVDKTPFYRLFVVGFTLTLPTAHFPFVNERKESHKFIMIISNSVCDGQLTKKDESAQNNSMKQLKTHLQKKKIRFQVLLGANSCRRNETEGKFFPLIS